MVPQAERSAGCRMSTDPHTRLGWGKLLGVSAVGAGLGFAIEGLHQRAGVWVSASGPDAALPWWIAGAYFAALVLAGWGFAWIGDRPGAALPDRPRWTLAVEMVTLAALFAAPIGLHRYELGFALAMTGLLVGRLARWWAPGDLAVAAVAIALDLAVESCLVAAALYHYANTSWLPLPLWLAPLWGCIGLSLRRVLQRTTRVA